MYQPKRVENAKILIANTPMDTDKVRNHNVHGFINCYFLYELNYCVHLQVKVFGSRVRVDSVAKVAEMEIAEKQKMKDKVCIWS